MANRSEMRTDLGNARRLVRAYGESLRYIHVWKSWVVWVGGRWRKDDNGSVMRMGKATIEEMFEEASEIDDESRRAAQRGYALQCQSAQRLDAMIKLAESEIESPPTGPQAASANDRRTAPFRDGRVTLARLPAFHWYKRSYDNALNDRRDELRAERM